ncbi:NmrA-like family-domain-containing protein [Xylariales sp. PMI_506]|nr:NmrA-like family-domain-containing protein [Xylariales sp. PMI_506]
MVFNRLAIYGHRGWASSSIAKALIATGAPTKVLYRPGSDVSSLPSTVTTIPVDVEDEAALVSALKDVDIAISLVGHEGIQRQHAFVKAIPQTKVKLFVPSDLGYLVDEQGSRIPVNKHKTEVLDAARAAGIATTVVMPGGFVESTLAIGLLGVDVPGNRIIFTGDSANKPWSMCTRNHVAAAYASIFASTPISELQGRAIGISELTATGEEIRAALGRRHAGLASGSGSGSGSESTSAEPQVIRLSLEDVEARIDFCIERGIPLALAWHCRKTWGAGSGVEMIGSDVWEVPGYQKATLEGLLVRGELGPYRELPAPVLAAINSTFEQL